MQGHRAYLDWPTHDTECIVSQHRISAPWRTDSLPRPMPYIHVRVSNAAMAAAMLACSGFRT